MNSAVELPASLIQDDDHAEPIALPAGMESLPRSSAPQYTLYRLIRHLKPEVVLEIGSQFGASAVAMALAQRDAGITGQIVAIDPFFPTGDNSGWGTMKIWYENVYNAGLKTSIQLLVTTSSAILPAMTRTYDFAFVDGSHQYEDVKEDLRLALHCLKPGGYVMVHDYAIYESVRNAAKETFQEFGIPYAENLIQTNQRGDVCGWAIARKPADAVIPAQPLRREVASPPPQPRRFRLFNLIPQPVKRGIRALLGRGK